MKNKINLLPLFVLFAFSSCYEDKGNYEYDTPNNIEVKGLEKEYSAFSNLTELDIQIDIVSDKKKEYDYIWTVIPWNTSGLVPQYDTIGYKKYLKYLVKKPQGTYKLVLRATEKDTNISYFFKSDLIVGTKYTKGWYVLKDDGVNTDLDLFNGDVHMVNVLPENGKIKGTAQYISPLKSYSYIDYNGVTQQSKNVFFIQSEDDTKVFLIEDMLKIKDYNDCFNIRVPKSPKQALVSSNYLSYALIDESGFYYMRTISSNIGVFDFPLEIEKGYTIDKFKIKTSFSASAFYDKLNCRLLAHVNNGFVELSNKNSEGQELANKPNNMNANCLYMSGFENVNSLPNACGIFENRDTKVHSLYLFNKGAFTSYFNPILSVTELKQNQSISRADVFGVNHDYTFIYFNNGNKLGYYNISNHMENDNIYQFEEGSVITHISYFYSGAISKKNLVVATYKAGKYKVYIFNTNAAKPEGEPEILEGNGRVAEAIYYEPIILLGASNYR